QPRGRHQRFRRLAGWQRDAVHVEPGLVQGFPDWRLMPGGDMLIGHDQRLAALAALPGKGADAGRITAGDGDVVRAFFEVHADLPKPFQEKYAPSRKGAKDPRTLVLKRLFGNARLRNSVSSRRVDSKRSFSTGVPKPDNIFQGCRNSL